jgi:hypothetical protein
MELRINEMGISELESMLMKFSKNFCGEIIDVTVGAPKQAKSGKGSYTAVKVTFKGGIVGRVNLYKGNDSPSYRKMGITSEMEDGTKKFKGFVSFGQDMIGDSYFNLSALVDGMASIVCSILR